VQSRLLAPEGPELALPPAISVIPLGATATFGSLAQTLITSGAYLIGYRTDGGSYLNPDLDPTFTCRASDELVVIRGELPAMKEPTA